MSKTITIIIRLLQGDPQQGLPIYVDISLMDDAGLGQHLLGRSLQSQPIASVLEIQSHYQALHQDWGQYSRWGDYPLRTSRGISIPEDQIHHYSGGEEQRKRELCRAANLDRIQQLDQWLDRCLQPILADILVQVFSQSQATPVRLVVETGNTQLQNLPWEKCARLIGNLSKGDRDVSTMIGVETIAHMHHWHQPLNILLIRGADENIDTDIDVVKIQKNLPRNANLRILNRPNWQELRTDLANQPQDMIIFAGHSMTNPDGQDGSIFINNTESLSINDLSDAFAKAVKQGGLKLLFFNSCEGMGLARKLARSVELEHKNLPYMIVMREKIHDRVAHDFLDQFLQFFFVQKYSLEQSVAAARKSIEIHESFSPGASTLPVLWGGSRGSPLSLVPSIKSWRSMVIDRRNLIKWLGFAGVGAVSALALSQIGKNSSTSIADLLSKSGTLPQLTKLEFTAVKLDKLGEIIELNGSNAEIFIEALGNGVELTMVKIPAGKFLMGSPASEKSRSTNESPQHQVNVPAFYLAQTLITQAQWRSIMGHHPTHLQGNDRLPVVEVSWLNAVDFCQKLSQKTGRTYRLPSEAEWEYACRAGTTTPFACGETITPAVVNYDGNYPYGEAAKSEHSGRRTPVGTFAPNRFGLYDLHGNLWEWCLDEWTDNYFDAPTDGSARGDMLPQRAKIRVLRGGSWGSPAADCRAAKRYFVAASIRGSYIGVRVVSVPSKTV